MGYGKLFLLLTTLIVAAVIIVAVVGLDLRVYFRKQKDKAEISAA